MEQWLNSAVGKAFNPDATYGLQCKDVADSYVIHLFGNWVHTLRPGNAKVVFDNSNPQYFVKVRNNPNDINQVPPRGAIICWDGNMGGGYGHIAVVLGASPNGFDVVEQDGFKQVPAYQKHYKNYRYVIGWLIPRIPEFDPKPAPTPTPTPAHVVTAPAPQPTKPAPAPILEPVKEINMREVIKEKVFSRKFLAVVAAGIYLFTTGQNDLAIEVIKAYLFAQGAVDLGQVFKR